MPGVGIMSVEAGRHRPSINFRLFFIVSGLSALLILGLSNVRKAEIEVFEDGGDDENDKLAANVGGEPAGVPDSQEVPDDNDNDDDGCPFRNSPLYRSVYVYPSPLETDLWSGDILSSQGRNNETFRPWPWLEIDRMTRNEGVAHYAVPGSLDQFTLELIVRDILTHPSSCLRTLDPENASLFYIPYLASVESRNGTLKRPAHYHSPYAMALYDAIEGQYTGWENLFGLTSKYWKRNDGADHIFVFSECMRGLKNHGPIAGTKTVYIDTQRMLRPPIMISTEQSKAFVKSYPKCAAKNVLVPYPNPDGRWYNGELEEEVSNLLRNVGIGSTKDSNAALAAEKKLSESNNYVGRHARPVTLYYAAGNHGKCKVLRKALADDYGCTSSSSVVASIDDEAFGYAIGMRTATFCPCPGGDSPSAKRNFDAILAGCIPVILSEDFVWPFTKEADSTFALDPYDFSLKWNVSNFDAPSYDEECNLIRDGEDSSVDATLRLVSTKEIKRLRKGVRKVMDLYSFYSRNPRGGVDNPLREGMLPDGGASRALVQALASRARGARWAGCQEELESLTHEIINEPFKC